MSKAEEDLPLKQKSNMNEGSDSAVKRENVMSKVAGPKKEGRNHRSDWKPNDSEMPAHLSLKQHTFQILFKSSAIELGTICFKML